MIRGYDGTYVTESRKFERVMEISQLAAAQILEDSGVKTEYGGPIVKEFLNKGFMFIPRGEMDWEYEDYQERKAKKDADIVLPPWRAYQPGIGMVGIYKHDWSFYLLRYVGS